MQLKTLLSTSALFTLAGGLLGPIYAIYVEQIGGDILEAGVAYALFALASGILIFVIGRWEDHVKHQEKLVVLGYLVSVLGFAGYLLIRNPVDLFLVQIIFGIGDAVGTPAYDGLYSKYMDKGRFASEWGLWESMYRIMTAIGAVGGGVLASLYGFRALFIVMLIMSLAGLVLSSALMYKGKTTPHRKRIARAQRPSAR